MFFSSINLNLPNYADDTTPDNAEITSIKFLNQLNKTHKLFQLFSGNFLVETLINISF